MYYYDNHTNGTNGTSGDPNSNFDDPSGVHNPSGDAFLGLAETKTKNKVGIKCTGKECP